MKVHISLNVRDINESVSFYKKMFAAEPVKHIIEQFGDASGYAKFDIAEPPLNLVLNERETTKGGQLSHLGLEVESTEKVENYRQQWTKAGLLTADEMDVTCCFARQDKTWIQDPDGNEWEAFVVLEHIQHMTEEEASCCDSTAFTQIGTAPGADQAASVCGPDEAESGCC